MKDFIFLDVSNRGEDITHKFLLSVLKKSQEDSVYKSNALARIIKNGGYLSYIKKLEAIYLPLEEL